ncbi:hypothetical protein INR49_032702 [Caranx melampygus]|nr:hypothetical protein INR49_032702 [Caranx melampygus]
MGRRFLWVSTTLPSPPVDVPQHLLEIHHLSVVCRHPVYKALETTVFSPESKPTPCGAAGRLAEYLNSSAADS